MGECTDTTDCIDVTISGIAGYADGSLSLYPNPTDGTVILQLSPAPCTLSPEIQLFDIYGQRLQVISVTGERTQIDLSPYPAGIYLVKLVNSGNVAAVGKVVKE